jgi:hypothetical protein
MQTNEDMLLFDDTAGHRWRRPMTSAGHRPRGAARRLSALISTSAALAQSEPAVYVVEELGTG